ncbi:MAG TPA: hypothetical protein VFE47_25630 [Tepidisphaeraceae bacterium]|nr:hypothetical protein [Tepidisphaeraceae bacterium]
MLAEFPKLRSVLRDFIEKAARIFIGEPARIVRKSTLDRLERLAYREQLRIAASRGDNELIEKEIANNQLTTGDLNRLARKHTAIEEWPDVDEDIVSPTLFDDSPAISHCQPIK